MKSNRTLNVICDECYQESSLSPHDQKVIYEQGYIRCKHCAMAVGFEETISQKIRTIMLLTFFVASALTILAVVLSHFIGDNALPASIAIIVVVMNLVVISIASSQPIKLVSSMRNYAVSH